MPLRPTSRHGRHAPWLSLLAFIGVVRAADVPECLLWNRTARALVAAHAVDPLMASRHYALLGVAQDLSAAAPHVFRRAAVAAASRRVLAEFYADDRPSLDEEVAAAQAALPRVPRALAIAIGDIVGQLVLAYAAHDRSDLVWTGTVPVGTGFWFSSLVPPKPPLRPRWGEVRTWFPASGGELQPDPPPAFGSAKFLAALQEVRDISDQRTAEQVAIAGFWADGAGTATPPGHWFAIADDLIAHSRLDERQAASLLSVLGCAMEDAGVATWDCKYVYWLIRPSQADPAITTVVPLPNFPSYTSGHSGFSAAAAVVLSAWFPEQAAHLAALAEEAAVSRLYGGIHYRFDCDVGLVIGRAVGERAVEAEGIRRLVAIQ